MLRPGRTMNNSKRYCSAEIRSKIRPFAQLARTSDSDRCSLQNGAPSGQDCHSYAKFACRVRDVSCWLGFEERDEKNARVNITMYVSMNTMYSTIYSTNDGYTRYNRKYGNMLTGNRNAYEN